MFSPIGAQQIDAKYAAPMGLMGNLLSLTLRFTQGYQNVAPMGLFNSHFPRH
ncbi:MAG: hypothetical protein JNL70_10325 [Saprospiraceae bacterium]|nr:hypothetical protein [Saprospiraceae bacterium]